MLTRNVAALSCAAACALVFACTIKTEAPNDGNTQDRDSGTPISTGADAATADGGADAGDGGVPDPQVCKAAATLDACEACCGMTDEVFDVLDRPFIECICNEKCTAECQTTFCSEARDEPDEACNECLDRESAACDERGDTACQANTSCKAFLTCAQAACSDFP